MLLLFSFSFTFFVVVILLFMQSPSGAYINPFGVEQSLHDVIGKLKNCYGDKKGKQYQVWVDQVFPAQIDLNTWVVKFKKLEQTGK